MTDHIKVEGNVDLYREKSSGAIINISRDKFYSFKTAQHNRKLLEEKVESLEQKIDLILKLLGQKEKI